MLDREFSGLRNQVKRTKTVHDSTLPHLRWELEQVMARVRPADLSAAEIASLLDVLRLAHSRVIGGPASRPALRVIDADSEYPAPHLAQ